jgi:hypothetical protein
MQCFGLFYRQLPNFACSSFLREASVMKTLLNFIKQRTQLRGKGRTKREDPSLSQRDAKTQRGPEVADRQRNKLDFRAFTSCKKHIQKEKGRET